MNEPTQQELDYQRKLDYFGVSEKDRDNPFIQEKIEYLLKVKPEELEEVKKKVNLNVQGKTLIDELYRYMRLAS